MNPTAPSRCPDACWIVVVLAAICAGLHIWDLPAAIPSVRHDLAMTLVQAGALLGVVQLAGMLGGLAVSLLAELAGERRCLLAGLAMASLGSAVGAAAPSVTALMVSRAVEGAGSIMVMVTGPGLIRRHATQPRINTAIGYWGASTGIAAFVGLAGQRRDPAGRILAPAVVGRYRPHAGIAAPGRRCPPGRPIPGAPAARQPPCGGSAPPSARPGPGSRDWPSPASPSSG